MVEQEYSLFSLVALFSFKINTVSAVKESSFGIGKADFFGNRLWVQVLPSYGM